MMYLYFQDEDPVAVAAEVAVEDLERGDLVVRVFHVFRHLVLMAVLLELVECSLVL
jgi:hypothetical protein